MSIPKEGYLYIVTGEKHLKEAMVSAKSLRKADEKAHITLITDKKVKDDLFDKILTRTPVRASVRIESWRRERAHGFLYRVKHMYQSPYDKTFFLDSDTYFCENCRELFDILDYFDICMAPSPDDRSLIKVGEKILGGYLPYNCGVILFKKNHQNEYLFQKWLEIYIRNLTPSYILDQSALMEALLTSKSRIYSLQSIYNARTPFAISFPGLDVKLIHGRHDNYEEIKSRINSVKVNRAWDPNRKKCSIYKKRKKLFPKLLRLTKDIIFGKQT